MLIMSITETVEITIGAEQLSNCKYMSQILRTLRDDSRHAYQDLHPGDAEKRMRFCQWLLKSTEENPDFFPKILWTDESLFSRRGIMDYHNIHVWAKKILEKFDHDNFKMNFP